MKIYFIVIVAFLSVCAMDFYSRLALKSGDTKWRDSENGVESLDIAKLDKDLLNKLTKALGQYDVVKVSPVVTPKIVSKSINQKIMSKEQQAKQRGVLKSLFDDVFEYTLKATFNDNGRKFALIERKNIKSSSKENISLTEGQSLSGYATRKIDNTAIFFEQGERKIQLRLFKQQTP